MIVNAGNLSTLYTAFKAAFQGGLGQAATQYGEVATTVPSSTGTEEYGWLGAFPNVREWVGDRQVKNIRAHGYSIKNRDFELTVAVPRPSIEDDQYGVYTPMMTEMGRAVAAHPDRLVFELLSQGHAQLCYDGQYFFDTDHPVIGEDGAPGTPQSNLDNNSGSGTRWYLLDCSRSLKPLIFQQRKAPQFVAKTDARDDNVFSRNEYVYGTDSRCNVGYGFWQQAYCSRKSLDETNLIAAFGAMSGRMGDHGRPLGIRATHLVVPPALEFTARKLVEAAEIGGTTNVLRGVLKVVSAPWLT